MRPPRSYAPQRALRKCLVVYVRGAIALEAGRPGRSPASQRPAALLAVRSAPTPGLPPARVDDYQSEPAELTRRRDSASDHGLHGRAKARLSRCRERRLRQHVSLCRYSYGAATAAAPTRLTCRYPHRAATERFGRYPRLDDKASG